MIEGEDGDEVTDRVESEAPTQGDFFGISDVPSLLLYSIRWKQVPQVQATLKGKGSHRRQESARAISEAA